MIDIRQQAEGILKRYPQGKQRAAILPLLHLVQERDGYVTQAGMEEVGRIVGITPAEVLSVASFYTMFHLKPKGTHVVGICHNMACTLRGAEELIDRVQRHLGIECGQTTEDGAFTLERQECLAACDRAPMLQIDYDRMYGPLTPQGAVDLLESVRKGEPVSPTPPRDAAVSPAAADAATHPAGPPHLEQATEHASPVSTLEPSARDYQPEDEG